MIRCAAAALLLTMFALSTFAQSPAATVILWDGGFPAVDTAPATRAELAAALPQAAFATAAELPEALSSARLLVLPYGSAFPEAAWPAILTFLERGGNLLVLGGRPLTRPAYLSDGGWKVRPENLAFARALLILDYQATAGSTNLQFTSNSDVMELPAFAWKQAYSAVIRLSDEDLSPREGSAGALDARLRALAWGARDGHKLAAPAVEIDHLRNRFAGGRWVFLAADLERAPGEQLVRKLAARAAEGAEDFTTQVAMPVLAPGEPLRLTVEWRRFGTPVEPARVEVTVTSEQGRVAQQSFNFAPPQWPLSAQIELPPPQAAGLLTITSKLYAGGRLRAVHRTGVWMRDEQFLRSGPRLAVNGDFFEMDGRPLPVVGTTYMASDVQRQFFAQPNPYVWDRDMTQISAAGLNMLRTGWWTGWSSLAENGVASEHTLRTLEAFLMTARRHHLPVQFTLFAFMPEVLGGGNPYLDPEALRRQRDFVSSLVTRFHDVPYLAWDLINEPSFSNPQRFWVTRPNGDPAELTAWNDWLRSRYPQGALADAWRTLPQPDVVPLPSDPDFAARAAYLGAHPLESYDFNLFAQEKFAAWAQGLREAIRTAGSTQLVTVGQDEGGGTDRPSPAFYAPAVDFATNHTWWLNDALLWDALVARVPGKPMLIQETGMQREWDLDGATRRTPESEARLLERKVAIALGAGAGAIEWLWNVNAYMRADGEVNIGALRVDETEKPDAAVLARYARFAAALRSHAVSPEMPQVAIVTSQALQYSVLGNMAAAAQQRAVRALEYGCRVPSYVVAENQVAQLGSPRLAILPSPQALTDAAWNALLAYVRGGGTLLITGPAERDEHWRMRGRLAKIGINAAVEPLTYRDATIHAGDRAVPLSFDASRQLTLDALRMPDGWAEAPVGKGRVLVAAYPVELAEDPRATQAIYDIALARAGVPRPFSATGLTDGVLVRPVVFAGSVLYLFVSESAADANFEVKDRLTGATLRFRLPSGRARLVLLDRRTGKTIATSE
jgi:hypothetical protein